MEELTGFRGLKIPSRIQPTSNSNFPTALSNILSPKPNEPVTAAAIGPEAQVAQCTDPAYPYPNCHYVSIGEMWRDVIRSHWTVLALASLLILLLAGLFVVLVLRGAERRRRAAGRRAAGMSSGERTGGGADAAVGESEEIEMGQARERDVQGDAERGRSGAP